MSDCQKEFATLVKATLRYLQSEWSDHSHLPLGGPPLKGQVFQNKDLAGVQVPAKFPSKSRASVVEKTNPTPKPAEKQPVPVQKTNNWSLNPMPLPTEFPPQFISFFKAIPLNIPIRLVVTDPSRIFFLENVARAITQWIVPAALFSGNLDTLLTNHNIQLVLAPLSFLKKRFPQVQLHQFLKLDGPALLPLADHYDTDLKRALWNSLKSFQNTPPSS